MAGVIDTIAAEKALSKKAADILRKNFKNQIKQAVDSKGESKKSTVRTRFSRDGRLDRITFFAPHYIYKQNYGFEGPKSNNVNMRLKATEVITKTLDTSGFLDTLVTEIAELRGESIIAKMNF